VPFLDTLGEWGREARSVFWPHVFFERLDPLVYTYCVSTASGAALDATDEESFLSCLLRYH
jgi:hypothetical protein